ncbi:DNA/RNA helicase domain-containing protein [Sphaerisporangium viridialbum]|uniref:DNA/RNA helicase domain-containing protein n=1 Tax=Sphaerisporangium viridialbum TaxID=46189 RepID=UPI003C74C14E
MLEYRLPATDERVDALVLGQRAGAAALTAVVVELKQWTNAAPLPTDRLSVKVSGRIVLHPARQVGGYVHYLDHWVPDSIKLLTRGVVVLHNASPEVVANLRHVVAGGASSQYQILGRNDLDAGTPARVLAERLGCDDLGPAPDSLIEQFLKVQHRPLPKLLSRVADAIDGDGDGGFALIGDQDTARLEILKAVSMARQGGPGHIVVVTGGPGTGKTAIAVRMFGELCRRANANPRLLSPSGTLTRQLTRAIGDAARGLITTFTDSLPAGLSKDSIILLDEAHRVRTFPDRHPGRPTILEHLIRRCGVTVLFLDERQIVRPTEGVTLEELRGLAASNDLTFAHIDLTTQFRCSGSQRYLRWIDTLFTEHGAPPSWQGQDYDLGLADNPRQLEDWMTSQIQLGHGARITAGFCWPWDSPSKPPLWPEVSIDWTDEQGTQRWQRAWNSRVNQAIGDEADIPGRPFWATDVGGDQQVGCVYTAQGMEYDYGGVIIGDDLIRTSSGWQGLPAKSHDSALRDLPPERYLSYVLNVYRVLATRGTRGTRLYSTDPATQRYLRDLFPDPGGNPG